MTAFSSEFTKKEADVALAVLRRYDCYCEEVITSGVRVKTYDYALEGSRKCWVPKDQAEGCLYLVKRSQLPFYKLVILSQYNKPGSFPKTTDIPISQQCVSQIHDRYYMFKNELGAIQAIMFPTQNECCQFSRKIEGIMKELRKSTKPNFMESIGSAINKKPHENLNDVMVCGNDDDKILSLLESARQRYNDVHGQGLQVSTSTPDRRSRQIDINELFTAMNSNGGGNTGHHSPIKKSSTIDLDSSYPHIGRTANRTMSLDLNDDNTSTTFTVTELEKFFVQGASVEEFAKKSSSEIEYSDDDDMQLLDPKKLFFDANRSQKEVTLLSKEQLKDTLIYILQNDKEDGGLFINRLHSAYLELCHKTKPIPKK